MENFCVRWYKKTKRKKITSLEVACWSAALSTKYMYVYACTVVWALLHLPNVWMCVYVCMYVSILIIHMHVTCTCAWVHIEARVRGGHWVSSSIILCLILWEWDSHRIGRVFFSFVFLLRGNPPPSSHIFPFSFSEPLHVWPRVEAPRICVSYNPTEGVR